MPLLHAHGGIYNTLLFIQLFIIFRYSTQFLIQFFSDCIMEKNLPPPPKKLLT